MEKRGDLLRLQKSVDSMGTTFTIILYGSDLHEMEAAVIDAFEEIGRLERMLSTYLPESEWSRINRMAPSGPVQVSAETFRLLTRAREFSNQSAGAFDPTVGALLRMWGFVGKSGRVPSEAEVAAALANVGCDHVLLNTAHTTVAFDRPGLEIDPGGIGKGYAVDRAVEVLKTRHISIALVAASSSTIYGMGSPPEEPGGWPVDIRDPWHPRASVASVYLKDMSISTSGTLERSFWAEGRLYTHIIDPRTGYPARGISAASVLARSATESEVWTKPCFINGRSWTEEYLPHGFRAFLCEDDQARRCGWVSSPEDTSILAP